MAELTGKAVSELPEATSVQDSDLLALSQDASSKKVSVKTLLDHVTLISNVDGIAAMQSVNSNHTVVSSMHVDQASNNPWFVRKVNGNTDYSGIVLAHTGIQHTEFNYFTQPQLIGLTFWVAANAYYRLCMGVGSNKTIFMEYFNGSTTTRIWTGTVT